MSALPKPDACPCGSPLPNHLAAVADGDSRFIHVCRCERSYRVESGKFVYVGTEQFAKPAPSLSLTLKLPLHQSRRAAQAQHHAFLAARLELRHDPQTERWTVVLCSRTTKEDVIVAWKQTEADAAAFAANYGVRS